MSALQPQTAYLSDYSNDRRKGHAFVQARYPTNTAHSTSLDQTVAQSNSGGMPSQDPFTYYRAFLDTESTSTLLSGDLDQHDDKDTRNVFRPEAQPTQGAGEQQQIRPRTNLAVRFANRSNGAPLATIIEQGSASTLNSHGSLLSVGRLPSIRVVENVSPGRTSRTRSRSLDNKVLKQIREEEQQEHASHSDATSGAQRKSIRPGISESYDGRATAANSDSPNKQQCRIPKLPEIDLDLERSGLKDFLRGVLSNVRISTRSRSRSSSVANTPMLDTPEQPCLKTPTRTSHGDIKSDGSKEQFSAVSPTIEPLSTISSSPFRAPEPQFTYRSSPSNETEPLAGFGAPVLHISPSTSATNTSLPSVPQTLLPDLSLLQNDKELIPSVCVVPPEPREAAPDHVRPGATTFVNHTSRDEISTQYASEGVVAQCNDERSLCEYARDSSRNASFCGTMSTSYSGTVLGIDLDLQHDFPHASRRTGTPVWFGSKESAKAQEQPKQELRCEAKEAKPLCPRSMTSSALTLLLPIAAAQGIVQQDLNTPQLSFYSPSGNLIQAQDASFASVSGSASASSSRSRVDSYSSGTPATPTSYYNSTEVSSAHSALSAAVTVPPARLTLFPLSTPQPTAPLPEHLRHHHNHQHVEKAQIVSDSEPISSVTSTLLTPSGTGVPGCGGVIRPTSLSPHSGVVPQSSPKHQRAGYSPSCLHVAESVQGSRAGRAFKANRTRFRSFSSRLTPKKGMTLKKRRPHTREASEHKSIGPVAGHALRACFCQPYDGSGKQIGDAGCGGTAQKRECQNDEHKNEMDTPNARVVASRDGDGDAGGKGKNRDRVRSDSGVGTGGGIRACGELISSHMIRPGADAAG